MPLGERGYLMKSTNLDDVRDEARNGDPEALEILGTWHFFGDHGHVKDTKQAMHLYLESAQKGWPEAMFKLGLMYDEGATAPKNDIEALKWLYLAAARNHRSAPTAIGCMERSMTANDVAAARALAEEWERASPRLPGR
jgi:TPR repeat protein